MSPASPHRIRLPAPWRVAYSSQAAPSLAATSAATPNVGGAIVFSRSFQRPTGLSDQSNIALEVTLTEPLLISIAINGNALPHRQASDLVCVASLPADRVSPVNKLDISVQACARTSAGSGVIEQPQFGRDYLSRVELILA